jgi:hypothetical protein
MNYSNDFATKLFKSLLLLTVLFLSFSTSKEQGGVVTFASPFLGLIILFLFPFAILKILKIDGYIFVVSLAYLLVMGVATLLSFDLLQSFVRYFYYIVAVFIFWFILVTYERLGISANYLASKIQLSGLILSLYFIGNFIYQSLDNNIVHVLYERQVGGLMSLPWGASNVVAQVLLLSMFASLFVGIRSRYSDIAVFLIFVCIVITMSRSVLLLSIPILIMYYGFGRFSMIMAVVCVIASYLVMTFVTDQVDMTGFYEFIERRTNSKELMSGNDRFELSTSKIEYFLRHPLEPVGFYSSINQFQSTAHNYWVTTLVEQSLVALMVSIILFVLFFARACVLGVKFGFGFFLIMLGLSVEDPQFTQQYTILLWFVFLLIQISYEQRLKLKDAE